MIKKLVLKEQISQISALYTANTGKNKIDAVSICVQEQGEEIHGSGHDLPEHIVHCHAAWKISPKTIQNPGSKSRVAS